MHKDNLSFSEKIKAWQKEPENKALSIAGDDRSPAWVWIGYTYNDGKHICIESDNVMTMLREGGCKVPTGKKQETYKKQSQSGILIDSQTWPLFEDGKQIPIKPLTELIGQSDFMAHIEAVEKAGFELFVKRGKIGTQKHVRVRPIFRNWSVAGTLTVLDEEMSGISKPVLEKILSQAGALVGLCDWRPSSPKSPGPYGKFTSVVTEIK
jgi:hypothetical protein